MPTLAIEFTPDAFHVAAMQSASRRSQLRHVFSEPIDSDAPNESIEKLKLALQEHGLSKLDAIAVVGRGDVELRVMEVPPAPENELPDIVRFVAKTEFASLNENWLFDFTRISGDQSNAGHVLAAGLNPTVQTRINTTFEQCGLKLKQIVLKPLAVVELLSRHLKPNELQLIVQPGNVSTDVTVLVGHTTIAARTIQHSENTDATILPQELKRTIASSRAFSKDQSLQRILLVTENEDPSGLLKPLSDSFDCDVKIVSVSDNGAVGSLLKNAPDANNYAAAIGSLTTVAGDHPPALDFANPKRPIVVKADHSRWYLYGGLAALAAAVLLIAGWWTLSSQATEIQTMETQLATITAKNNGESGQPSVDQTLAEIQKLDNWVLESTDWQKQLLDYSKNSMTANEIIVDRFEGRISKDNTVKIDVQARTADNAAETDVIEKLSSAFNVTLAKTEILDEPDYTSSTGLEVMLAVNRKIETKKIDARAKAHLDQLRIKQQTKTIGAE